MYCLQVLKCVFFQHLNEPNTTKELNLFLFNLVNMTSTVGHHVYFRNPSITQLIWCSYQNICESGNWFKTLTSAPSSDFFNTATTSSWKATSSTHLGLLFKVKKIFNKPQSRTSYHRNIHRFGLSPAQWSLIGPQVQYIKMLQSCQRFTNLVC